MAGINDLINSHNNNHCFKKEYCQLLDTIASLNPDAQLFLENILPVNHRMRPELPPTEKIINANEIIKETANERELIFIDLFTQYADKDGELLDTLTRDGIHLRPGGYYLWGMSIKEYLEND